MTVGVVQNQGGRNAAPTKGMLEVVAVFVGEEHAVGMAGGENARLFERDGRTNASVLANDAEAAFGRAIIV